MQNGAMAMAYSAGDKLKSSARDFLKNLEAWKAQEEMPTTLETAISKMFGSCTIGSAAGVELHFDGDAPGDPTASPIKRLRNPVITPDSFRAKRTLKTDFGEQVYEHLFVDDQQQEPLPPPPSQQQRRSPSARAADSVREAEPKDAPHMEQHRLTVQTSFPQSDPKNMRNMFPSSPPQKLTVIPANMVATPDSMKVTTPLGSAHLLVPNRTFDDSISAISAYTLEAMVQAEKLRHSPSNDSSLFPSSKDTHQPRTVPERSISPTWGFGRKRSERTHGSRNSKTSETTGDSTEHSKWVNGEQNFWEQEANACASPKSFGVSKPYKTRRAKSQTSRKTNDHTVSTSSCSHSSFAHPHDTIPFEPADLFPPPLSQDEVLGSTAFARDPNRIDQVLVLPVDTELAEI
ncbi:hypothetical protein ACA910_021449 [Epithemia clementina (nom. ined.)]